MTKPRERLENDRRIRRKGILLHLLENRDADSPLGGISGLIADSGGIGRGAWREAPVLTLDETVCDSEDRVDDDGVDAFGDLVLYSVIKFVFFWRYLSVGR
jgi:hypothetical protein